MESLLVQLVTVAEPADEFTVMSLLSKASPVVQAALVVLVLMSVISWYIIVYKWIYFRRATKESDIFLQTFWRSKRLDEIYDTSDDLKYSPVSHVFREGYKELTKLRRTKSIRCTVKWGISRTSNAPFAGPSRQSPCIWRG